MKTTNFIYPLIALLLSLIATQQAPGAESLKIAPARAFPDYEKVRLATTTNTGPHLHPIFDIGDLNKDGRLDVAMFEMDGPDSPGPNPVHSLAAVFLQNAEGSFVRQSETYLLPIRFVPRDFILADFNGDGSLDLLLNDYSIDLILLLGKGDGTFQTPVNLLLNALAFPTVADLNGDGHLDIVAATREGAAMVFLGAGDGTFTPGVRLDTVTNPIGQRRGQIMIGDLNNDGKLDVAVASVLDFTVTDTGNLDVFVGRGDGTFESPIRNANVGVWRGALGDFNGDGILDYAGDRFSPEAIEIWLGTGDGHFKKRGSYTMAGYWPGFITLGDLNGDGLLDIVASSLTTDNRPAPLGIFLGNGDGTFRPRRLHNPIDGLGHSDLGPKLIDLNRDGFLDIVCVAYTSNVVTNHFAVNLNRGSTLDPALGFQVTIHSTTNRPVVLESSIDLRVWTPFATNAPSGDWPLMDMRSGARQRFYRTRQP